MAGFDGFYPEEDRKQDGEPVDWNVGLVRENPKPAKHDVITSPKHYMLIPEKDVEVRDVVRAVVDSDSN